MAKSTAGHDPLLGQIVGGRYEIVRLIGKGGMGSIYEVRNTRLGRSFALKTLTGDAADDPEVLQRFRREADVVARIKHPNIVEVIDWEALEDGSPAMVMEYLEGEDLAERIRTSSPLAWPFIARVGDQVLAALSIAHANGVVHRDLKPQNIFLAMDDSGEERVKLLDFGVSKIRDSKSLVTTDARLLGTPAYMSPEQAEGRAGDVGTHTDVWAIGAILQEMATSELAFDAPSLPALLYKVCHGEAVAITRADAPPAYVALIKETLTRDIAQRLSDATVLRVRLREALRGIAGVQYTETLPPVRATHSVSASGRRKRFTGAHEDTVGATPGHAKIALGTPVNEAGTANTMMAAAATPSMITRRKWAPMALGVGALTVATVAIAIVLAARDKEPDARRTPKAVEQAVQRPADAATAPEVVAPDAAPAAAVAPIGTEAAKPVGARPSRTRPSTTKPAGTKPGTTEPGQGAHAAGEGAPRVDPPKPDPPKSRCGHLTKGTPEHDTCMFGDGT